jgi:hypothetical protein
LQLSCWFRRALYSVLTLMFVTGVVWLAADWQKSGPQGDLWQSIAAWLLMVHGGGAMATLLFIGALVPLHMYRGWRAKRNRISGGAMALENAVLIATSFGLYYVGSDVIRPWMSDIHIGAGFCLPLLLVVHIMLGRRSARQRTQAPLESPASPMTR